MPRPEAEPVNFTISNRPSLGDLKRWYTVAMGEPGCWVTILWEDQKGRPFDAVNPHREVRGPRRQEILQALSPEPGDDGKILRAKIIIHKVPKTAVAAKKDG